MHLQFPLVPLPGFMEAWQNANFWIAAVVCLVCGSLGVEALGSNAFLEKPKKSLAILGSVLIGITVFWAVFGLYLPATVLLASLVGTVVYIIYKNTKAIKGKKSE